MWLYRADKLEEHNLTWLKTQSCLISLFLVLRWGCHSFLREFQPFSESQLQWPLLSWAFSGFSQRKIDLAFLWISMLLCLQVSHGTKFNLIFCKWKLNTYISFSYILSLGHLQHLLGEFKTNEKRSKFHLIFIFSKNLAQPDARSSSTILNTKYSTDGSS